MQRHVLAEAPYWQIIETYWNTAMQQCNIWSIAFEARTKEILQEVCLINISQWIFHAQSGTRFAHKSIRFNLISFNRYGTTLQSFIYLQRFQSAAEHLEFIDSLLADNKYLVPVAERVEGGVCGPNPTQ
jgi:hypothetical protein